MSAKSDFIHTIKATSIVLVFLQIPLDIKEQIRDKITEKAESFMLSDAINSTINFILTRIFKLMMPIKDATIS